MIRPRLDVSLADLGCEEITDDETPRGLRVFRCRWADRFRVAHTLLHLFGNVEINGEDPITDEYGHKNSARRPPSLGGGRNCRSVVVGVG